MKRIRRSPRCLHVLLVAGLLLAIPCHAQLSSQAKAQAPKDAKAFVPLKDLVAVLENILDAVQAHLMAEKSPPLQSAEFDFQTVTTNDVSGGLIISIVTAEGEHTKVTTRETDFTYTVPTQPAANAHLMSPNIRRFDWLTSLFASLRKTAQPEDFNKTLPAAILAAADTMSVVRSINVPGGAALSQRTFAVTLTFSVTNAFNGGVDPSSLILVAPELKYTHSVQSVQTLKLTFADN